MMKILKKINGFHIYVFGIFLLIISIKYPILNISFLSREANELLEFLLTVLFIPSIFFCSPLMIAVYDYKLNPTKIFGKLYFFLTFIAYVFTLYLYYYYSINLDGGNFILSYGLITYIIQFILVVHFGAKKRKTNYHLLILLAAPILFHGTIIIKILSLFLELLLGGYS